MAQVQAAAQVDTIDDDASFLTILQSFCLVGRARQRFTEDFPNICELMSVDEDQIKSVSVTQNKIYSILLQLVREHTYLNLIQLVS